MINFQKITEENFSQIINMKLPEVSFVASNCYSLAQAWLYRDEGDVFPFAICYNDTPVGFMMLEEDREDQKLWLWRIMISSEYSGNGYGTAAMQLLFHYIRESGKYSSLYLNCNENNTVAMGLYQNLGFVFTGNTNHADMEMRLDL